MFHPHSQIEFHPYSSRVRLWIAGAFCAYVCMVSMGCVSRRMTIRSNPPGALVEVDGERIGLTPVSMDFTYYGTREISLSAPGYETLTVLQPVPAPLGQKFPVDFFTNHFMPRKKTDRHDFTYSLVQKSMPVNEEADLINRARNFRSQAEIGGVVQP